MTTVTNFENYDKPLMTFVGMPESLQYSITKEQIQTISFEQIVVKTIDGHLRRSEREDRSILFKTTTYKNKARNIFGRIQLVEFELTNDIIQVERSYNNLIDLWSAIGGLANGLVFVCVAVGAMHNQITFNQYIQNEIFCPESNPSGTNNNNKTIYSYFEILKLTYCCTNKKNPRRR